MTVRRPRHIVQCTDAGWTIKHPLSCRPDLFNCPVNRAAEASLWGDIPAGNGRHYIEIGPGGFLYATGPAPERTDTGRSFNDLPTSGLLWLINRVVFHPRGYALALVIDDHGDAAGWTLQGDGTEPWRFADPSREDEHFADVAETLRAAATAPRSTSAPPYDPHRDHIIVVGPPTGNGREVTFAHAAGCADIVCVFMPAVRALDVSAWAPGVYRLQWRTPTSGELTAELIPDPAQSGQPSANRPPRPALDAGRVDASGQPTRRANRGGKDGGPGGAEEA